MSCDIYHSGVHFPTNLDGTNIAQHCLSAALSDLAATGAKPLAVTLAVSAKDPSWISRLFDLIFAWNIISIVAPTQAIAPLDLAPMHKGAQGFAACLVLACHLVSFFDA